MIIFWYKTVHFIISFFSFLLWCLFDDASKYTWFISRPVVFIKRTPNTIAKYTIYKEEEEKIMK